jgi:energy-coupling factor transporter ATP-binding protein EcfA2
MALANVAYIIAWRNPSTKVLMIDWDLEAPGLRRFFFGREKTHSYGNSETDCPGLIDFMHEVRRVYEGQESYGQLSIEFAHTTFAQDVFEDALRKCSLSKYIFTIDPLRPVDLTPIASPSLFLMTAGKRNLSVYVKQVRSFDWVAFYEKYGSFFALFREHLASEYDVVLIDSRTGLTDIGDICTRVMPEKLVAVFAPNTQNIEGLLEIVKGAAKHRKNSRDPRGLVVFPLASRIDGARGALRNIWWQGGKFGDQVVDGYERSFEELFKSIYELEKCDLHDFFDRTQVPHDSDFAYGERIAAAVGSSDRLSISFACNNLVQYIMEDRVPWKEERTDRVNTLPGLNKFIYDVFVSYSPADRRHAAQIDSEVRARGLKTFFDRSEVVGGQRWLRALEQAIDASKSAMVLIGPRGLSSTQQYERDLAIIRQTRDPTFSIFPVILPEAGIDPPLSLLRSLTWIDFSHVSEVSEAPFEFEQLLRILHGDAPDMVREAICPYRGLDAFREEDSAFFFGRGAADDSESPIGQLVRKVGQHSFVMVIGRSGSGKSSLVYAGLVPALRHQRDRIWHVLNLRPGPEPLRALAAAFNPRSIDEGAAEYAAKIGVESEQLRVGPELLSHMIRQELDRSRVRPDRLLLYIDQWEELYAQAPSPGADKDRAARHAADVNRFIDLLLNVTHSSPITIVATVRADFYHLLISHERIQALLPGQHVLLGSMPRAELERTIVEPAKMVGLVFDPPKLVSRILDDAGEDEGMLRSDREGRPTVEIVHEALIRSWPRFRDWIDANREKLGAHAAILQAKVEWEQHGRREDLLLPSGYQLERARSIVADPGDITIDDIEAFVAESEAVHGRRHAEEVERERRRQVAELEAANARAAIAERDRQRQAAELESARVRERAASATAAASRSVARRTLVGLAAALVLALLAFGIGIYARSQTVEAVRQKAEAERQTILAEAKTKEAEASFRERQRQESLLRTEQARQAGADAVTAALLALEGLPDATSTDVAARTRPFVNEAWRVLYNALLAQRELTVLSGHTGPVSSAVFAPDGGGIVTASDDRTARLWGRDGQALAIVSSRCARRAL